MSIYININNQQAGPFDDAAVLQWLQNGQLLPDDLAIRQGAKEWQPLKTLFPIPPQFSAPVVANAAVNNEQAFSNQTAVNWARRNLPTPVKVRGLFNSLIFTVFTYTFLALIFLVPPCLILIVTIIDFITNGLQKSPKDGLAIGIVWLVVGGGLFLIIVLIRRNIATVLTSEGVKIKGRKNYLWENLCFLNYKTILAKGGKQLALELVFTNGKAVVPPHTSNKSEILRLFETLPVQRRDNGRIRQ